MSEEPNTKLRSDLAAAELARDSYAQQLIQCRDVCSIARALASQDAHKIKRLIDVLVRADNALDHCGVGKKTPVRINIQDALK